MRIRIRPQLIVGVLVGFASLLGATGASTALAMTEGPGWELSATTYPSNLVQGVDEVQEVAANPAEATFTLEFEKQKTASIPKEAKAAVVQGAIEALSA